MARLGLSSPQERYVREQLRGAPDACFPMVTDRGEVTIRPDRPIKELISVDPTGHLDMRRYPTVKGPDLPWLGTRLEMSRKRGFDEGLLVDSLGVPIEGIFSALVVWREEPIVSAHPRALESTTAALLGFRRDILTPEDLCRPLWLLNAFSGVRTTHPDYPVAEVNRLLWEQADEV